MEVCRGKVTRGFRVNIGYWARGRGTRAALSPDGTRIALADGENVAVVGLRAGKVVTRKAKAAAALGYSPTGRLWTFS
jgi:hypothetical protein